MPFSDPSSARVGCASAARSEQRAAPSDVVSQPVRTLTRVEDLLRAHGRNDLYEQDELLSTSSPWDYEVFDSDDGIEVWIGDVGMAMNYPFTLADFNELVGDVETLAAESVGEDA